MDPRKNSEAVVDACLAKFDPPIESIARAAIARLRALCPGATELVYDAYNALSIPFATGEKLGSAFVSVVVYPRHVNLGFLRGAELDDPEKLLQGTGAKIRHVRIEPSTMKDAAVVRLIRDAAALAGFEPKGGAIGPIVVKRIYPRQRPRRPSKG